ncbi:hypothetical protein [Burkholderia singularis]|uniref:hypothetical protein n=1 Tax=Burkholderia singularis TaxID=1503053 RepID=UPI00117FB7C3|nr:hypothetical protein [Burkholderia singularis]
MTSSPDLAIREWLADHLVGLAGFINQRDMSFPTIEIRVVNVQGIGESGCGTQNDVECPTIDSASEAIPVRSKNASTTDVHFDFGLLGSFAKPGRKFIFYFPS